MAGKYVALNLRLCVLFIIPLTIHSIIRFNVYEQNRIDDQCQSNESFQYVLADTGLSSSMKILPYSWYSKDRNCTIEIQPPSGFGVILRVVSMFESVPPSNRMSDHCLTYIQIFGDNGNSTKICGRLTESAGYVTKGVMKLHYYTSSRNGFPGAAFNLVITAYKRDGECDYNQFSCPSNECIWQGLVCDGTENCPDGSDEKASCVDIASFTMRPIDWDWNVIYPTTSITTFRKSFNVTLSAAIASAILILLVGLIRFFCHYHCAQARRQDVLRGIAIIRTRSAFPQNTHQQAPPPPYTSLVNEAVTSNMPSNPPEYSSVVQDETTTAGITSASNNQTDSRDQASKNSVTEPPPPYEP